MAIKRNIKRSNVILGKNLERVRLKKDMTCMQLGRKVNQNKQQILRYECGEALVPLAVLEKIAVVLDEPIAKRIIRKISILRKLEIENCKEMADELIELYNQALPED